MSFQAIITDEQDCSWHSIRDTDREALYKVADYMRNSVDSHLVAIGDFIQGELIFGKSIESITNEIKKDGFNLIVKYFP